jgi:hypothetical protein
MVFWESLFNASFFRNLFVICVLSFSEGNGFLFRRISFFSMTLLRSFYEIDLNFKLTLRSVECFERFYQDVSLRIQHMSCYCSKFASKSCSAGFGLLETSVREDGCSLFNGPILPVYFQTNNLLKVILMSNFQL